MILNILMASPTICNEIIEAVCRSVPCKAVGAKRHYMMNIKCSTVFLWSFATALTHLIAGKCFDALPIPVGAIIMIVAPSPVWMLFTTLGFGLIKSGMLSITEIVLWLIFAVANVFTGYWLTAPSTRRAANSSYGLDITVSHMRPTSWRTSFDVPNTACCKWLTTCKTDFINKAAGIAVSSLIGSLKQLPTATTLFRGFRCVYHNGPYSTETLTNIQGLERI